MTPVCVWPGCSKAAPMSPEPYCGHHWFAFSATTRHAVVEARQVDGRGSEAYRAAINVMGLEAERRARQKP